MKALPPELEEALENSAADCDAAAEVLRIAAKYLRTGEAMPFGLSLFLADAIDRAMKKAPSVRGSELLLNLKLKANNKRRSSANFEHVGRDLDRLIASKMRRDDAIHKLTQDYGISEKTVERRLKEYVEFSAFELQQDELLHQGVVQVKPQTLRKNTTKKR